MRNGLPGPAATGADAQSLPPHRQCLKTSKVKWRGIVMIGDGASAPCRLSVLRDPQGCCCEAPVVYGRERAKGRSMNGEDGLISWREGMASLRRGPEPAPHSNLCGKIGEVKKKTSGECFLVGCFGQVIYGMQEAQRSRRSSAWTFPSWTWSSVHSLHGSSMHQHLRSAAEQPARSVCASCFRGVR